MASTKKPAAQADEAPAVEPVEVLEAKESPAGDVDTWSIEEHIRASEDMYGQPSWLVAALMKDENPNVHYSKQQVQDKIDAFNGRPVYGGDQ